MKYLIIAIIAGAALFFYSYKKDNPTASATLRVGVEEVQRKLTELVGKDKVAIKLMEDALVDRKDRLVRIKTIKNTLTRRADELETTAGQFDKEGKAEMAKQTREAATDYRTRLIALGTQETEATASLKKCSEDYEKFKLEIDSITEKIAVEKAVGGLSDDLSVGSPMATKLEAAKSLKADLLLELDRAKALTEVNKLEAGLTK